MSASAAGTDLGELPPPGPTWASCVPHRYVTCPGPDGMKLWGRSGLFPTNTGEAGKAAIERDDGGTVTPAF